jgi:ketosteroid isomerase-like protein
VVTVATTTGTRQGKPVSYTGISITRFADGKMVEGWGLWDRLGLYQQLGVVAETPDLMKQAGLET